ncbi:MAG: alpha/beta fold hydrolase, partial [Dehalococcoidia bacterium]|nr:alpha/beta fold hydrolase [Dehalococcoidia bacterium]
MEQPVSFYSRGLKIAGVLFSPEGPTMVGGRPGVVLCQGFTGIKESFLPPVAQRLAEMGFYALTFDYRFFGESQGEPRFQLLPQVQVEDTRNAITFLQLQLGVDPERMGLYGTSFGGAIASYTTGTDDRVKCLVSTSGIGNGERWLRGMRHFWQWQHLSSRLEEDRRQRLLNGSSAYVDTLDIMVPDPSTQSFWDKTTPLALKQLPQWSTQITLESAEAVMAFKPEEVVAAISPRAAMWIHSVRDELVPLGESQAMHQRAGEPRALARISCGHWDVYRREPFEEVMAHA